MTNDSTYDVQVWKMDKYVGSKVTTHRVRWVVAGKQWRKGFRTAAAADSFRSDLVAAQRRGEAFDRASGRPMSTVRQESAARTWYDFARVYVDMKWPAASAGYRRAVAEALCSVTVALLPEPVDFTSRQLRSALTYWAFNAGRRSAEVPSGVSEVLSWAARNSPPLRKLAEPGIVRKVLDAFAVRLDGKRSAASVVNRKRAVLFNAMAYAVELGLLDANPVTGVKWRAPKSSHAVDRRSVVNPTQARALLAAVAATPRSGPRLVAFFGLMYFAALRPEEAVALRAMDLELVDGGMGWITMMTLT